MRSVSIRCINCKSPVKVTRRKAAAVSGGTFLLNVPGIACGGECLDDLLFVVPDPPGLVCLLELTVEVVENAMYEIEFLAGSEAAGAFFMKLFPTSARVIQSAAVRLHYEGNKKKAYAILNHGIKHSDEPQRLLLERAAFYSFDGRPERGLRIVKKLSPDLPRYHVIKGNLLKNTGKWEEAAVCWSKGIEVDPSDVFPWNNLGYYLLHVKKSYNEAEQHYRRACEIFPEHHRFRAYVGDALFFQGRKGKALREYRRALSMTKDDEEFEQSLRNMIRACHED